MYRGSSLKCPACHGTLEYTRASLPVHGCGACGGLWLGPEAAMLVLQGRGGTIESDIVRTDRRASAPPNVAPVVPDDQVRRCPSCDLEMGTLVVGEVRVDSCPAHGTWFDRREVTRVTEKLAALRRDAKRREAEAGLPSPGDLVDDTASVVGLSFRAAVRLFEDFSAWLGRSGHEASCTCRHCTRERWP